MPNKDASIIQPLFSVNEGLMHISFSDFTPVRLSFHLSNGEVLGCIKAFKGYFNNLYFAFERSGSFMEDKLEFMLRILCYSREREGSGSATPLLVQNCALTGRAVRASGGSGARV